MLEPSGSEQPFDDEVASASVLVIDDEPGMRHFLQKALGGKCRLVDAVENTAKATNLIDEIGYDIIIIDNIMPGQSGLEWLREQSEIGLHSDVIVMTAFADLETAIDAIRAGASDFLLKPFRTNQVLNAISKCLVKSRLRRQNSALRHELAESNDILRQRDSLIGSSQATQEVKHQIATAASIEANVVILGESGTGKQIAARMLHAASSRASQPFTWMQCFGVELAEFRERMFGRVDATGTEVEGILRYANSGILYLEDIEMLAPQCQNLLMEWISAGRFQPIGRQRSFPTNIRVICSCTEPLRQAVEENRFRPDLYYQLSVHEIRLPPLRERPGDIMEILEVFLQSLSARMGAKRPELSASVKRKIMSHDWPGNVMELRNLVERAIIMGSFEAAMADGKSENTESLAALEQRHILSVIEACDGNRAEAARRLGVARKTIDRKCKAWGL